MDRFGRVLRRVERRLQAPDPERSRILMELASDLEDLYRAYRERGLDEEEARRRAERWLAPSGPALEALGSVHRPAFDRLLGRLSGTTRGRIELGLVALVSAAAVGAAVFAVLQSGTLPASTPGLWILALLVAGGVAVAVRHGYALFVRGDRLGPGWRRELALVLATAAGAALTGLAAGGLRLTLTAAGAEAEGLPAEFWSEVATASSVAALGLSASLLLGLVWLVLRVRGRAVSRARAELRERLGPMAGESHTFETGARLGRERTS